MSGARCAGCGRQLRGGARYRFVQGSDGAVEKDLWCALRHPPLVAKALRVALVVGTILTIINQGDALLAGSLSPVLLWKIPLTYAVPYSVSTYSALAISRVGE